MKGGRMKKVIVFGFVPLLLISGLFVNPLDAQILDTQFTVQGGGIFSDSFNFKYIYGTFGLSYDVFFNEMLFISPDLYLVVPDFHFDRLLIAPGVMANLKFNNFFFGIGATKWLSVTSNGATHPAYFKIQAGFRSDRLVITGFAVMLFDNLFKDMNIGITFGYHD